MYVFAGVLPAFVAVLAMLSASSASVITELSLDDAVEQAVSVDPRIQSAAAHWQVVTAETQARMTPADPELELEFEGMASAFDVSSHDERSIGLTQRLALPMAWFHNRAATHATTDAVRLEHVDAARLDVVLETATAYLDVLLAERLLILSSDDLERAENLAHMARRRRDIGGAPLLAALRAEVESGRANLRVADGQDAVAAARARLNTLLDLPLDADVALTDQLEVHHIDREETALHDLALAQRPDIVAAALHQQAASRATRAARASVLPAVDLGLFRHDIDAAGAPTTWRLKATVEVPLWAARQQRSKIAVAQARFRQLEHDLTEVRRRAKLAVNSAYRDYTRTHRTLTLLDDGLLREAGAAYEAARRSWEQGQAPQVDVIDAQRTLTEVRMDHTRAIHMHEIARHTLIRAVGGHLDTDGGSDR
jgi:outer membrane protein TolC